MPYFSSAPREVFTGHGTVYGIRTKSAQGTGTEGHQSRNCSHQNHYFTSGKPERNKTCSSCVLMLKATNCNIFCDGISVQHLAAVLISVYTLSYGPGLLFRGPPCIRNNYLHKKKGKLTKQCKKSLPARH